MVAMISFALTCLHLCIDIHTFEIMGYGFQVYQITVTSSYGISEFRESLLALYNKAGVKGNQVAFLITDNQIVSEKFLVYLNDFLSTGYISDLCTPVRLYTPSSGGV